MLHFLVWHTQFDYPGRNLIVVLTTARWRIGGSQSSVIVESLVIRVVWGCGTDLGFAIGALKMCTLFTGRHALLRCPLSRFQENEVNKGVCPAVFSS